jgi:hypothetical protein
MIFCPASIENRVQIIQKYYKTRCKGQSIWAVVVPVEAGFLAIPN